MEQQHSPTSIRDQWSHLLLASKKNAGFNVVVLLRLFSDQVLYRGNMAVQLLAPLPHSKEGPGLRSRCGTAWVSSGYSAFTTHQNIRVILQSVAVTKALVKIWSRSWAHTHAAHCSLVPVSPCCTSYDT